jgi:hypothetical protein
MKYMSVTTAILSLFFFGTSVQADQLQCNSIEETERAIIKLKKDPLLLQFGCHGEIEVWRISNATSTTFTYGYEHYLKTKVDGSLMFRSSDSFIDNKPQSLLAPREFVTASTAYEYDEACPEPSLKDFDYAYVYVLEKENFFVPLGKFLGLECDVTVERIEIPKEVMKKVRP